MKIYNLSRVIAIPLLIAFVWIVYKTFTDDYFTHSIWMIPPCLLLATIYMFSPQIDYWWWNFRKYGIEDQIKTLIEKYNPEYKSLNDEETAKFDRRLYLFMEGKDFVAKGTEDKEVPHDVKAIISQVAIQMTLGQGPKVFEDIERIVMYKHPFTTPRIPFLHSVETYQEHGMMIISLEHMEHAMEHGNKVYNIVWHAFAELYVHKKEKTLDNAIPTLDWDTLEKIAGYDEKYILGIIGTPDVNPRAVAIHHYFLYPRKFLELATKEFALLHEEFETKTDKTA